jgi:uracil-DNA glycosylase
VVILGQDPYHGPNQAHGLSFSVPRGERIPPSLQNIYKELARDVDFRIPKHGYLMPWAEQGVLLLNSVLTVQAGLAASHQGKGWEAFTDQIISLISQRRDHVVFLLWGAYAQKKGHAIDRDKHLVLSTTHPSPLSAHRGFLGCGHFSKANEYLRQHQMTPIDWQLPE